MHRTFLLALALVLPVSAGAQGAAAAPRQVPEIDAGGVGVVKLRPDRATVTIAVVTRAGSAADAGRQNVARIVPVIAALKRQGLADSAIVTSGYAVSLERDSYGRPSAADAPPTYVARNAIRVTFEDLERLGQLLDTALIAGATEIAGVAFASSEAGPARQRAIAEAVRAARADAESAAVAAGGSLGALIELRVDPGPTVAYAASSISDFYGSGYAATAVPLMPSDISVRVPVRVRFAFTPR